MLYQSLVFERIWWVGGGDLGGGWVNCFVWNVVCVCFYWEVVGCSTSPVLWWGSSAYVVPVQKLVPALVHVTCVASIVYYGRGICANDTGASTPWWVLELFLGCYFIFIHHIKPWIAYSVDVFCNRTMSWTLDIILCMLHVCVSAP